MRTINIENIKDAGWALLNAFSHCDDENYGECYLDKVNDYEECAGEWKDYLYNNYGIGNMRELYDFIKTFTDEENASEFIVEMSQYARYLDASRFLDFVGYCWRVAEVREDNENRCWRDCEICDYRDECYDSNYDYETAREIIQEGGDPFESLSYWDLEEQCDMEGEF